MSSKLVQIFEQIEAEVAKRIPDAKFLRGRKHLHDNESTPRIVYVRTQDQDAPGQQTNPRIFVRATSVANVECYLYAADDCGEALKDAFIVAVKRICGTAATIGNARWFTPKNMEGCELAILTIRIAMPVIDSTQSETEIDSVGFEVEENLYDEQLHAEETFPHV